MDTSLLGFDSLDTFSSHYTSNGFRGAASEASQTCSKKYSEEWFSLFEQGDIARRLKEKALRLELADCRFRSICWKIFLECLPDSRNDWIIATRAMRHKYESLLAKTCHNPRMELEDLDLAYNNPLSQDEKSPWNQYFEDSELRIMIKQDVIRTFPEIEFFQTSDVQAMMVNVLFHYARQHPQISYRQGMHELLAPIIFVLHNDQQAFLHALELDYIREFQDALRDDIRELLNPDYTEHDAFFLFNQVMDAVESWYSWNENYVKIDQFSFMPFAKTSTLGLHNGLGVKLCRINQSMLKAHDFAIYTHLENMEIPLHVFGIRWLRLLFGREFILPELLILWDAIFADSLAFNLVDYIFVAMLICIRKPLLNSDYAKCLSFLMKYPAGRNVTYILQLALHLKDAKKYLKPGEQEFEVYSPSLVTKISGKSLLAVDAPRSIGRPVGRPNTLGIQASSSRASSEPTTLESGSEVSDEESAASRGKGRVAPLRSQPKHNQVWSFRGIKKNPITQSLSLLASSGSEGDQHEKEMVQLNSTVGMRHGSIEGSEVPPWQRHNSVADTQKTPTLEIQQLRKQVFDMQQVMDSCCRQMSDHLALLQESMLSQQLQREDEVMLAIARLKRVRDTLKGAVECIDVGKEDDDAQGEYVTEGWTLLSSDEQLEQQQQPSLLDTDGDSLISWDSQEKAKESDSHHALEAKRKLFKALVHNQKPATALGDGMAASSLS
ncbi:TBC1 domain family member 5-like isoform X1 [Dermacentor albipictus]|uniref:TBC1 domain family member 5-like isoform X1 n=1 Tax=Dermacentor albipictus TaxID=60249 RepID=UPI0038FCC9C2